MLYNQYIFTKKNIKNLQTFYTNKKNLKKKKYSEKKNIIIHYTPYINHLPKYLFSILIIFLKPIKKYIINNILYSHHP